MRSHNPPMCPAELTARQAAGHTDQIRREWQLIFGRNESWPEEAVCAALTPWLAGHPTRGATREQAAIHEAGHFVVFECVEMIACTARIYGPRGGGGAWTGTAAPATRAKWSAIYGENFGGSAMVGGEAIAAMAGPIAEELIGGGDALSSIGELIGGSIWAARAGELTNTPEKAAVSSAVATSVSLVECLAPEIQDIGQVLAHRKHISRDRSIEKILARMPKGTPVASTLTAPGRAIRDKILGAFDHLWFFAPIARTITAKGLSEVEQ
jgi:hypothetical protein